MTDVWVIRHGESESNAGLPSSSDISTPLTNRGIEQAHHVSNRINSAPDLFVLSPYLRTQQTAAPTLLKYPGTPVEIWPVQEFSYLGHDQYRNTTTKDRRDLSKSYFKEANPEIVFGDGGESFHQFVQRVINAIDSLKKAKVNKIIIFGHGWFTRALLWQLYYQKPTRRIKKEFLNRVNLILPSSRFALKLFHWLEPYKWMRKMFSFLIFSAGVQTPNCSIFKFSVDEKKGLILKDYEISHLPEYLRETTMTNR